MVIKFTRDVSSLGMGKDFKKGQRVPADFPNIKALLDDGIAAEEEETTIPSKAAASDSKAVTLDMLYLIKAMSYSELSDLLSKNKLKVSGSKEDKLQRLIEYYEGGGE